MRNQFRFRTSFTGIDLSAERIFSFSLMVLSAHYPVISDVMESPHFSPIGCERFIRRIWGFQVQA